MNNPERHDEGVDNRTHEPSIETTQARSEVSGIQTDTTKEWTTRNMNQQPPARPPEDTKQTEAKLQNAGAA